MDPSSPCRVMRGWGGLACGLALLVLFVVGLHHLSVVLPGSTGEMIASNRDLDVEVQAIFYSEVGSVEGFLDDERGRYGRAALRLDGTQ